MTPVITLSQETIPLLTEGAPVLVGLSGGRDSVALLHILKSYGGISLLACHINHGIRVGEAERDEAFSRTLCDRLSIPFVSKKVSVPALAKTWGMSVETAARRARHEAFSTWADEYGSRVVVLAHHLNDQAETILFNLCRGGGGVQGMKVISQWDNGLHVLRPLLHTTRWQITEYLLSLGLTWVDDSSNEEIEYTRNALRQEVLPLLEKIMKRDVLTAMDRAARISSERDMALAQAIQALNLTDSQGRLYLPTLEELPRQLQQCAVFQYAKQVGVTDISEATILRILSVIPIENPSRISLPGGWIARRKEKRLILTRS